MAFADEMMLAATGQRPRKKPFLPGGGGADLPTRPAPPGRTPIPKSNPEDAAELYFQRQRQLNPYGRGYAEGEPHPVGPGQPTLRSLNETVQTPMMAPGFNDISQLTRQPMPGEYIPLPGEDLSLPEIIRRFSVAPGGSF